jgi:hypothetical protein
VRFDELAGEWQTQPEGSLTPETGLVDSVKAVENARQVIR